MRAPIHLLPKLIVSCLVYGGNSGSDGTITWNTGTDLSYNNGTGAYDDFKLMPKAVGARVDSSDNPFVLNITSQTDLTFTISELMASSGAAALPAIANSCDYIKVVLLYRPKGATSGGTYRAAIGRIESAEYGLSQQTGKNIYTLNADSAGIPPYEGSTLPTVFS